MFHPPPAGKRKASFKTYQLKTPVTQPVASHTSNSRDVSDSRQDRLSLSSDTRAGDAEKTQDAVLNQLEEAASHKYMGSPTADFLLTLIQFNVFRALLRNTFTLGLTTDWLKNEMLSPICYGCFNGSAPSSLQPTLLQRTIDHHPWLDLFPFPAMRDNLLRSYGKYDEDQLCGDLVGWCRSPGARVGLIVWREPWDPSGWEATEGFLETWGWTVRGCGEIRWATNYWRAQRGEEPLLFEEPSFESV